MTAIRPVLRHASPRKGDPFSGGEASRADAGLDAQRIQDFGSKDRLVRVGQPGCGHRSGPCGCQFLRSARSGVAACLRPRTRMNTNIFRLETRASAVSLRVRRVGGCPAGVPPPRVARRVTEAENTFPYSPRASTSSISNAARSAS